MNLLYSIIKTEIDNCQKTAIELMVKGIDKKDVRISFFTLFQSYYIDLYRIYSLMDSKDFIIDTEQIYFNIQGKDDETDKINLISHQNSNLIISTWSTFELCLTQICRKILPQVIINKLLDSKFNEIIKIVKDSLNQEVKDELLKKQKHTYLEHVSINLKMDQIFKITKYSNLDNDKKFLLFYGKLRNCVHSNYVYYGNLFEYKFKDIRYIFEPERPIKIDPLNFNNDLSTFNLSIELRNIFYRIISNIDYDNLIFNPSYSNVK